MSWKELTRMELRREFVLLARMPQANIRLLCRRFDIAPKTAYKWLKRFDELGDKGLHDQSRRPHHSPARTQSEDEKRVIQLRLEYHWGGRKLHRRLRDLGWEHPPAPSTITHILRRHQLIQTEISHSSKPSIRFQRDQPNELWQMDFKGHFPTLRGRCHPLTVLDDHSRFSIGLAACPNEQLAGVRHWLALWFSKFGLPEGLLMDNASLWAGGHGQPWSALTVWLLRLGIRILHGRPRHPQTQGKEERFHRTLKEELVRYETFKDLKHCQKRFDQWRLVYNHQRPHQALDMDTPASHYQPSSRPFPKTLPSIEYAPGDCVRKVQAEGIVSFQGRRLKLSQAFVGLPVAIRPALVDGHVDVFFCAQSIRRIDLRQKEEIS